MYYQQDWLMRQIEMTVDFVIRLVFKSSAEEFSLLEEADKASSGRLWEELEALLAAGQLGDAEDLLYANFERDNLNYLRLALHFYSELNTLEDEVLEAADFTREEIEEGLEELLRRWGVARPWGEKRTDETTV